MVGIAPTLLTLTICLHLASGFFWSDSDPVWNELKITWSGKTPIFNKWAFDPMPLTRKDAEDQDFRQIGNRDTDCSGAFNGFRYIYNNDPAVILLYDINGYIAGIQTSFPQSLIHPKGLDWFKGIQMFTQEELTLKNKTDTHYTLTAYFQDPDKICTTGRSESDVASAPLGDNLYLKNGTEAQLIPRDESALQSTSWTQGKCFPTMGVHYWYNITGDMNCDNFQPVFLLYNSNRLTGFGFVAFSNVDSVRYEHPDWFVFPAFMKTVPECVTSKVKVTGVSTLHHYFNTDVKHLIC